ncbi:hypothetical protein KKH26_02585 [Patescibacteria group bacterium]|nr:hypothetical protein [Patescibacteria group bacterium]
MAKSVRKFIRREKARIRREIFDPKKQDESIIKLISRFIKTDIKSKNES